MKKNETGILLLTVISIAVLLVTLIGAAFTFVSARYFLPEKSEPIIFEPGILDINFSTGSAVFEIAQVNELRDGILLKEISVIGSNKVDVKMPYQIELLVSYNSFSDDSLKFILIRESLNEELEVLVSNNSNILLTRSYFSGIVDNLNHEYTLKAILNSDEEISGSFQGQIRISVITE